MWQFYDKTTTFFESDWKRAIDTWRRASWHEYKFAQLIRHRSTLKRKQAKYLLYFINNTNWL